MKEKLLDNVEVLTMPEVTVTIGPPIGKGYGAITAEGIAVDEAAKELATETKNHLVRVSEDAPSCCIDGRNCVACMDGSGTEPRPGVAGGGLVTSYAAAELIGWFPDDAGDTQERVESVQHQLKANNIKNGGHCDQSAVAVDFDGKTGCGANDKLPEILARAKSDKDDIDAFTKLILDDSFDERCTEFTDADILASRHMGWNPKGVIEVIGIKEGPNHIEILASDDSPTHGHKELAVVFNNVENTTVDRDALFAATGKQVFDVDVWYLRKLARAMATGPDAVAQESRLLHAMVAYQVATYLTLCDGSQRPIFVNQATPQAA